ncbi:sodium/hydrogen exchanger 9-like isoform X1 [Mytilus galloprovincialis]|uniref:sodium/hydrogen exchanger 9-like isoform X1 n=1 Tax=Mytilus galloprovincialis TaxID=29158 RepID=UPI003F7C7EC8
MADKMTTKIRLLVLFNLFNYAMPSASTPATIGPADADTKEELHVLAQHKIDSLTILMLLGLLMLTILTIWLFKHKRLRFLHESGLSLIYGMIVGAVIKYTASNKCDSSPYVRLNGTAYYTAPNPPAAVYLKLPQSFNSSNLKEIKYDLWGEVSEDTIHCTGSLVRAVHAFSTKVTFDPEFFFNVLLPFIIFEAGYSMKRRHFFKNLGAIMAYAFIGTTISCVVVGGIMYGLTRFMKDIVKEFTLNDCFWFGAIISATDPVTILSIFSDLRADVDLFAFIFGESVLNDAVAIVLSSSVDSYRLKSNQEGFNANAFFLSIGNFAKIFLGAFGIGSALGCVNALISKFTKIRDFPLLETALLFLMSYMSFQACEAAELTGIVGILFCGITQAHYTYNNLSEESKHRTKQLFELMNFLAENFVFLYIGVSIFTFQYQYWHAGFIFASVFSIIVARFCNIYPLSLLLNIGRKNKIKTSFMHMMMFSGLRGAIAYALSIRNTATTAKKLMVSSTMFIVLITVILCGGLTTPMLQWLQIRVGVDEDVEMKNIKESREGSGRGATYQSMDNHNENNASPLHVFEDRSSSAGSPLLERDTEQIEQTPPKKKYDKAWLVSLWHNFDIKFMKPLLTNSTPNLMETLHPCCMPLSRLLTTEEQMTNPCVHIEADSDTDMIIDHRELSIGESISTVSHGATQDTDKHDITEDSLIDDNILGDLGHGQPMRLQINVPGPLGENV